MLWPSPGRAGVCGVSALCTLAEVVLSVVLSLERPGAPSRLSQVLAPLQLGRPGSRRHSSSLTAASGLGMEGPWVAGSSVG